MNRRATTMPPKSELTMNARNYVWIFTIVLLCVLCAGVVSIAAHPQQNPPQENTQAPPPPTDPQDPRFKLNVEVELVNITATVLDEQGKYMDGLKLEDFQGSQGGRRNRGIRRNRAGRERGNEEGKAQQESFASGHGWFRYQEPHQFDAG